MVETRLAHRHRIMKAAKIEFGGDAIDCMVRDLSVAGAALEVSNQISIPAKFLLAWISTAKMPTNAGKAN